MNDTTSKASTRRRFSGKALAIGGGALAAAAVLAATLSIGAANATGAGSDDPSIRQAPGDNGWIAEDTFSEPGQADDAPAGIIEEGSDIDPGSDMLDNGPASMVVEGSHVDPSWVMLDATS